MIRETDTKNRFKKLDQIEKLETDLQENEPEKVEPYKIYINNIYSYIDDFIESKYDGQTQTELKNNRAFFPHLVNYLYNNYIGDLLGNKINARYKKVIYPDIEILNDLFDIYLSLVYQYKFNNRPTVIEFCIFTGLDHNTVIKWNKGEFINDYNNIYNNSMDNTNINNTDNNTGALYNKRGNKDSKRHLTTEYIDSVRKWYTICESALVDGNGEYVKEIFLLKACHGYKDNNNDIYIHTDNKPVIDADILPDLLQIVAKK